MKKQKLKENFVYSIYCKPKRRLKNGNWRFDYYCEAFVVAHTIRRRGKSMLVNLYVDKILKINGKKMLLKIMIPMPRQALWRMLKLTDKIIPIKFNDAMRNQTVPEKYIPLLHGLNIMRKKKSKTQ